MNNGNENKKGAFPIFLGFLPIELHEYACKESKRQGLTVQNWIRTLIAKDKDKTQINK